MRARFRAGRVRGKAGYTLTELVMVIAIVGIVATMAARNLSTPVTMFLDNVRRAELTDAAALALLRMSRDIRGALPNSLRVSGGAALELLAVVDGERYRGDPPGSASDRLAFTPAGDASFNTLGPLGTFDVSAPLGSSVIYAAHRLAVYPLGQTGADPYTDTVMTTAQTITVTSVAAPSPPQTANEYRVALAGAHTFPLESPAQRVFLVSGPVSYVCAGGELRRYSGYALAAAQPVPPAGASALIVDHVESCNFSYQNVAQRRGLATLILVLEAQGERVRLLRQVHVDNTP